MALPGTSPVPSDAQAAGRGRRAGRMLMLLMVPFLVVGVALTVSIFGAYFGIPLLAGSWPVFRAGRRAYRQPTDPAALRRVTVLASVAAGVLTVAIVITAVVGLDDLDSALDLGALTVAVLWTAGIWSAAVGARAAIR